MLRRTRDDQAVQKPFPNLCYRSDPTSDCQVEVGREVEGALTVGSGKGRDSVETFSSILIDGNEYDGEKGSSERKTVSHIRRRGRNT